MPSRGKAASPLHSALLKRLRVLFEERGVSIKDGMKAAGSNEQNYNLWQRGASPKLITLETMASKLDMSVLELLGGQRSVFTTPESAEIAASIDSLPQDQREAIAKSAQALAIMYRSGMIKKA